MRGQSLHLGHRGTDVGLQAIAGAKQQHRTSGVVGLHDVHDLLDRLWLPLLGQTDLDKQIRS